MIEEISIRNLGVIAEARLPLGAGFTALTGETGAGKTMVVTALGLLLGDRADSSAVRAGSSQAVVEGHWRIPADGPVAERVQDAGGDVDEGELILSRSVSTDGRSRAIVGGRSAPVGVLSELGQQLVVVHGQSDQIRLRSATAQREALDRFAGAPLAAVRDEYAAAFSGWQRSQSELDVLTAERSRRQREADELRAAMAAIDQVAPLRGEDLDLADRAARLANIEDLRLAASEAHELISSENIGDAQDAVAMLDHARRVLERVAVHDSTLAPIAEAVSEASFALHDISGQLSSYLSGLDTDSARELELVQERRAALSALVRLYGPTLDDVLDYLESGSLRLLELDSDSDRIDTLSAEVERCSAVVRDLADTLTELRATAAERLSSEVTAELTALAMQAASLRVEVADRVDFGATGKDTVTFSLIPHSGAEPRPLGRGASGGELSRLMLAIEVVIAGADPVPTFIFDEVDAGVGGASAIEIGRRLAQLARTSQVIVVTHLAQVAAFANNHLTVVKDSDGEVTASSIRQLAGDDRVVELARMLSGLPGSQTGLEHARELIAAASQAKTPAHS